MTLRFERVSHRRTDLQDDRKWPTPCMPYGRGSIGQTWTILKSGPGWLLMLIEEEKPVVIRGWYPE